MVCVCACVCTSGCNSCTFAFTVESVCFLRVEEGRRPPHAYGAVVRRRGHEAGDGRVPAHAVDGARVAREFRDGKFAAAVPDVDFVVWGSEGGGSVGVRGRSLKLWKTAQSSRRTFAATGNEVFVVSSEAGVDCVEALGHTLVLSHQHPVLEVPQVHSLGRAGTTDRPVRNRQQRALCTAADAETSVGAYLSCYI